MALRTVRVKVGEHWYTVEVDDISTSPVHVTVEGETFLVEVPGLPQAKRSARRKTSDQKTAGHAISEKLIRSPMPGRVMAVNVKPGQSVGTGQEVCVVEAMKMEQSIRVGQEGIIKTIYVKPMQQVGADDPLIELE